MQQQSFSANLKRARFHAPSPLPVAALRPMSLIPSAPFTNSHQMIQQLIQVLYSL